MRRGIALAQFERHFTYEEAQERVPWVRSVFGRVHAVLRSLEHPAGLGPAFAESYGVVRSDDRQTYRLLQEIPQLASPEVLIERLTPEEKKELLHGLVRGLKAEGIFVQDIRRGLIDFPAWKDGREVLLCYELADGDLLGYWHEIDAGYAGRQEILPDDLM
jgi:hypothetical protein